MRIFFNLKSLLVVGLFTVVSASCKKDGGSGSASYFVKAKVNGTEIQFTGFTLATFQTIPGTTLYMCSIQGQQDLNSPLNILSALITDESPITTNKEYSDDVVGGTLQGVVSYYDGNNNQYSSGFATSPNVKITLTEITDAYVAGTFSGNATAALSNETVAITEGSFKVKR